MEILLELVLEPIIKIIFLGIGYPLGFFPVLIGSVGTVEPGPLGSAVDGGGFYRSKGMKWWHLTYFDGGKRYLPAGTVAFEGWLLLLSISILVWAILHTMLGVA